MAQDIKALTAGLQSEDVAMRIDAAERVASLGEAAAALAIPLVKALGDADETVRELVTSALEDCGAPASSEIEPLKQLLANQNADIAYWAATLLGRLGDKAGHASEALHTAAAKHASPVVRKRAAWALEKIGSG